MSGFHSRLVSHLALLSGVSFLFVGAVSAGAQAGPPASLVGAPLPSPNGFNSFLEAANHYVRGVEGTPGTDEVLPFDENLRRQRSTVSRNIKALRYLRNGLQLPVLHPPVSDYSTDFGYYGGFRVLGSLLKQESAVRVSNVDWAGAMDSDLDCIQLGVAMTRGGPLRASVAGRAIENLGRRDLDPIINKLSAKECRAAAARLVEIEALRPPFSDPIRQEKITALTLTRLSFEQLDWSEVVGQTLKPNGEHFSNEEMFALSNIGQNEVQSNITRVLEQVMSTADAPYRPAKTRVERGPDPWSRLLTDAAATPNFRVDYEAARAQDWLLKLALELRAEKLEAGAYPVTFATAIDPFADPSSDDPKLKYRRDKDSYLLYSVGPNGKDDGGTPLKLAESGAIPPDASGDLLAPVFSQ